MDKSNPVNTLFLDIGGVMLTNGWGHESRRLAADVFNPDFNDMNDRHHFNQITYEEGKLTPAAGLPMGTRPGDLDPGVAWYIMRSENLTPKQFNQLINHESGLLGISETSSEKRSAK